MIGKIRTIRDFRQFMQLREESTDTGSLVLKDQADQELQVDTYSMGYLPKYDVITRSAKSSIQKKI
ncbi:MAG: hypothetical protein ACLTS1_10510 [Coprococcus sp.]